MAYAQFDVATVETEFGVRVLPGSVFPELRPVPVPAWLTDFLARGAELRVESEKARNEFIVAPVLLAVRELTGGRAAVFSGERFDVDPAAGLIGECDFLLTLAPAVPIIRAPAVVVVEAKRQDIAGGLGQCTAQMVAARRFNVRNGRAPATVYGCVTTGEEWQFLRLADDPVITYDPARLYRNEVGRILAAFLHAVAENAAVAAA
ncbi:MAG: hypothetical protein K2X82_06645 [Gemmataceae bacterium]|nr:hypothetical protein [Gemmataceae bacterium]